MPKNVAAAGLAVLAWMNLAIPVAFAVASTVDLPLVSAPGDVAAIPTWDIQSTAKITTDPAALSRPGTVLGGDSDSSISSSSWYHVPVSRCTIMGCLSKAGVYNDSDLFFSDRMAAFDQLQFQVPWLYRSEFRLRVNATSSGSRNDTNKYSTHYLLETHGITSSADIYINGWQVANRVKQSGAYGGHVYDVTDVMGEANVIVVRAYPTDYFRDFSLGFVDWNPYPPDNGTGVWRNVTLRQTGPVAIESLSVTTDFSVVDAASGTVTIRAVVRNLDKTTSVQLDINAAVAREDGTGEQAAKLEPLATDTSGIQLTAGQAMQLTLTAAVSTPVVWWPRQWGDQPLYRARLRVSVAGQTSDSASKTFGFRQVTAAVGGAGDIMFRINGRPFQVLGGGYNPDVFLRWDETRFAAQARYALHMGLNTIRLEGKMEQPELYAVADRLGLMVLAGWECCDKWEAWAYNENLPQPVTVWTEADYGTANASMRHEAAVMQAHPSILGFLVGGDYWPDDRATALYSARLADAGWQAPVVASAGKIGYPQALGPGGMKMTGPYDWVPPHYWYAVSPADDNARHGAAFGFGSEQGAGAGTPALSSLRRFLSEADLEDLWRAPDKGLYHMSTADSFFHDRSIYNAALKQRYGEATSLADYVLRAQMADYEATRAEFEAFSAFWTPDENDSRPATGVVYWMLNGGWPTLHWALIDHYLLPAGAYFGVKAAAGRLEHVVYDYAHRSVVLINRSRDRAGRRSVQAELIDVNGRVLASTATRPGALNSTPNTSQMALQTIPGLTALTDVVFLKLTLADGDTNHTLSRGVYWLGPGDDSLDWGSSTWFYTPTIAYTSFRGLDALALANVTVVPKKTADDGRHNITLANWSTVPAVFVHLRLVDAVGADVTPVLWSDNYITLWPRETLQLTLEEILSGAGTARGAAIQVGGKNVETTVVSL